MNRCAIMLAAAGRWPITAPTNVAENGLCRGRMSPNRATFARACRLRGLIEMGLSISEIARRLGRHRATIHRETAQPADALPRCSRNASRGEAVGGERAGASPLFPTARPSIRGQLRRSQFGHWEGDLMHFRNQRDILLTLQERKSRLTLGRRLLGKGADGAAQAIAEELAGLPASARRTPHRRAAATVERAPRRHEPGRPPPRAAGVCRAVKQTVPLYDLRHRVKPGLTGWTQVKDAYAASEVETRRRLSRDLYYIKCGSLRLDFKIMAETAWVMLAYRGSQ